MMQQLQNKQLSMVSGGGMSVHLNTEIPLNYLPIIANYADSVERGDLTGLVKALSDAGLDPNKLSVHVAFSLYS